MIKWKQRMLHYLPAKMHVWAKCIKQWLTKTIFSSFFGGGYLLNETWSKYIHLYLMQNGLVSWFHLWQDKAATNFASQVSTAIVLLSSKYSKIYPLLRWYYWTSKAPGNCALWLLPTFGKTEGVTNSNLLKFTNVGCTYVNINDSRAFLGYSYHILHQQDTNRKEGKVSWNRADRVTAYPGNFLADQKRCIATSVPC